MDDTGYDDLLCTLRGLEVALHQPEVRADRSRLAALLHPAFREFGRAGARYRREQMLADLPAQLSGADIWSQDFEVQRLAEGLALLTYRSAHVKAGGRLERHTNRASLWQHTPDGWQMRFHQGTPTEAFEPDEASAGRAVPRDDA